MLRPIFTFPFPVIPQRKYLYASNGQNYPLVDNIRPPLPLSLHPTLRKRRLLPSLKQTNSSESTLSVSSMEPSSDEDEVIHDLSPVLKVYKSGRVERLAGVEVVPPSIDPETNVESKDVVISEEEGISARIFLPKLTDPNQKLPLLVYFHGGAFCIETPFSPNYHNYLNSITSKAHIIGVSVHYRRAPEHPVPTAQEDSWAAVKWVASHFGGNGPDEWLNRHADFGKVFFAGDSAGANISHHMAIRVQTERLAGLQLEGLALIHPYFWGVERTGSESNQPEYIVKVDNLWRFVCPTTSGSDDPLINPAKDPNLGNLVCSRVLVCVAEQDLLRDRGWSYKELLDKNGFSGHVELMETKEENHVFHMFKPTCENAVALLNRIVSFIKHG